MDFGKYIKELLMIHDCVILPGLGGFIANYKPAGIQSAQQMIHPPSRNILFNRNLVHNDGLLYAHASEKSGYGYKDVQSLAESYIRQILRDVEKGSKFTLEDIGYFYRDREKNLQFSASTSSNLLLESYGLPSLHFREFDAPRLGEKRRYRAVPAELDPLGRQKRARRIVISAAAACIAAALLIVPIRTGYFSEARLDVPAGDTFTPTEIVREAAEITKEALQEQAISQSAPAAEIPIPDSHDVIVGSFRDFGNARQLRNKLVEKGFQPRILAGDNGFYRVSAGQSSAREDAGRVLASTHSAGYDSAWLLSD